MMKKGKYCGESSRSNAARRQFNMGGRVNSDAKSDKPMIAKAVHKHETAMHAGKPKTPMKHGGRA